MSNGNRFGTDRQDDPWVLVTPVPDNAPIPKFVHFRMGPAVAHWQYRDERGRCLGYVCRFETPTGKQFAPLTLHRNRKTGRMEWRWKSWPKPRPLYGMDKLPANPNASVVLCEGEKAADAAARLLPDHIAIASPNGALGTASVDWTPLTGRDVLIWPDADAPGLRYSDDAAGSLLDVNAVVRIVQPPEGVAPGWDAADAETEGWDEDEVLSLIRSAQPFRVDRAKKTTSRASKRSEQDREPKVRDQLFALTADWELWHSPERIAYASVHIGDHIENFQLQSDDGRRALTSCYYEQTKNALTKQTLDDAMRCLEARALFDGAFHRTWRRVAEGPNGEVYIDLCDKDWRAVQIDRLGWRVVDRAPVKFIRSPGMLPLPEPETGEMIERLREFINFGSDDDYKLIVAWLVAALRPAGPYPIAAISGEQGSGKSLATRLLRDLVDPNVSSCRSLPDRERDLAVSARNSWLQSYDNISGVSGPISDALCRLSTGGGVASRKLHTDCDEVIIDACRPIILNGIPNLAEAVEKVSGIAGLPVIPLR